jgi:N-dimethylarginine dimethylaminohydrolase
MRCGRRCPRNSDWEIIEVDDEEQKLGACNSIPLGNKKVMMVSCPRLSSTSYVRPIAAAARSVAEVRPAWASNWR